MICLDTNVVSRLIKPAPPLRLVRRMAAVPAKEQSTTAITLAELLHGASRRPDLNLEERIWAAVRSAQVVFPFDTAAAEVYGPLRAGLEREGRPLPHADLCIASIALARDLTLVTGNVRHFSRVPGLRVENWLEA
ncbi:MAG TPA: PIN domain-containing protein [Gaiella sp.]|nr:PIN domain-containing protein [Gaiella sp.]